MPIPSPPRPQPRLWDISQILRPGLPVWPGDTAFSHRPRWSIGVGGSPVNVAAFETTTHAGTHADAPLHYAADGLDSAAVDLDPYLGACRVVDARGAGDLVTAAFLGEHLAAPPPRILLRTFHAFPRDAWEASFTAIGADAIHWLASEGVVLIGVDAPSLDPQTSQTMDAHHAVLAHDMRILEGLVLDDVPPGDYELIALPLKLAGLDSSPVRAVLREMNPPPSPLWGGGREERPTTDGEAVRVGHVEAAEILQAAPYPTLGASRRVPPHEGEGGVGRP